MISLFLTIAIVVALFCYLLVPGNFIGCLIIGIIVSCFITEIVAEVQELKTPEGRAKSKRRAKKLDDYTNRYGKIDTWSFRDKDEK